MEIVGSKIVGGGRGRRRHLFFRMISSDDFVPYFDMFRSGIIAHADVFFLFWKTSAAYCKRLRQCRRGKET